MKMSKLITMVGTGIASIYMAYKAYSSKRKLRIPKEEVNMGNVLNSMFNSRDLYKDLFTRTHPDRWVNNKLHSQMEDLSARVHANKNDYEMLKELELEFIELKSK